jgi:hypothetical protein
MQREGDYIKRIEASILPVKSTLLTAIWGLVNLGQLYHSEQMITLI